MNEYTPNELGIISNFLSFLNSNKNIFEEDFVSFSPIQIWVGGEPLGYIKENDIVSEFRFFAGEYKEEL